ncbi:hypothetical protein CWT12_12270 [Actinomyces sp. 432]|uniref:hypothetical protein n=1 Tax=Actinomyces sp. 432 TaxID=2057798 RepID=UPI001374306C|nr:hypothetical protein [Actinomyces sp. 432]QHO91927.1 hypothetical protein CWT12_12270 [Actinomyces sp. 432]
MAGHVMVTVGGVRYRLEDAQALGLVDVEARLGRHQAEPAAPEPEAEPEPEAAVKPSRRRRPTATNQ